MISRFGFCNRTTFRSSDHPDSGKDQRVRDGIQAGDGQLGNGWAVYLSEKARARADFEEKDFKIRLKVVDGKIIVEKAD